MRSSLKPSLRLVLALAFGTLGLVATFALAALASRKAGRRLEGQIGAELAELAFHMADRLDTGMFERWRDIQAAASLNAFRDPHIGIDEKRATLKRLNDTYPD